MFIGCTQENKIEEPELIEVMFELEDNSYISHIAIITLQGKINGNIVNWKLGVTQNVTSEPMQLDKSENNILQSVEWSKTDIKTDLNYKLNKSGIIKIYYNSESKEFNIIE